MGQKVWFDKTPGVVCGVADDDESDDELEDGSVRCRVSELARRQPDEVKLRGKVLSTEFSPDGRFLAARTMRGEYDRDHSVHVIDLQRFAALDAGDGDRGAGDCGPGLVLRTFGLDEHDGPGLPAAFRPSHGSVLAITGFWGKEGIRTINVGEMGATKGGGAEDSDDSDAEDPEHLAFHPPGSRMEAPDAIAFSPCGDLVCCATHGGHVRLISADKEVAVKRLGEPRWQKVRKVAFSPCGGRIIALVETKRHRRQAGVTIGFGSRHNVSVSWRQHLALIDATTLEVLDMKALTGEEERESVRSMALSPCGATVALGQTRGLLTIANVGATGVHVPSAADVPAETATTTMPTAMRRRRRRVRGPVAWGRGSWRWRSARAAGPSPPPPRAGRCALSRSTGSAWSGG